ARPRRFSPRPRSRFGLRFHEESVVAGLASSGPARQAGPTSSLRLDVDPPRQQLARRAPPPGLDPPPPPSPGIRPRGTPPRLLRLEVAVERGQTGAHGRGGRVREDRPDEVRA